MSTTPQPAPQPIYSLLPAVYRSRDDLLGDPLAAFYSVLESQYGIVKDNLLQLYDDQFIETCAPWVIPYIGALIGYDPVFMVAQAGADSRAEVANAIGYRRRKGTLIAMEQVTHDVSGRSTMAVEEFRRLITTLSLRDVRRHHNATANLRRGRDWEDQWGPFTRLNRTVDVRRIGPRIPTPPPPVITTPPTTTAQPDPTPLDIAIHGGGRFNIPDVAVWMWRWQAFAVTNAPAFPLPASNGSSNDGNGYFFSALGGPIPLFQPTVGEALPFASLTKEPDVPEPIRRRRFAKHTADFYPSDLQLVSDGALVPEDLIMCANLEPGPGGEICTVPAGMIAIDPMLGRIQFAQGFTPLPNNLLVSYNYGSPAEFAGGPYDRTASINQPASGQQASGFPAIVQSSTVPVIVPTGYTEYTTLQDAVTQWNMQPAGSVGTIVLTNFDSIDITGLSAINIPAQSQLLIASAEVPAGTTKNGPPPQWKNSCVTLFGKIEVCAPKAPLGPDGLSEPMGSLQISGVWLSGTISLTGHAACVQMTDCTLVPGITLQPDGTAAQPGAPSVTGTAIGARFCLTRAISGPISLPSSCTVRVCNSIVDAGSDSNPAFVGPAGSGAVTALFPGAELHIEDSTVIGKVYAQAIWLASNTIFHSALAASDDWNAAVWSNRTQVGCVRFCSLPWSSIVPRRYECLPPNAASEQALAPQFISLRFGDPAYCLLSGDCPMAVWKGADNGSQMGVFLQIQETEAVENIQIRANEYLVANLQCGVFLIPSHGCDTVVEIPGGINRLPPPGQGDPVPAPEPKLTVAEETQPQSAAHVETEPEFEAEPEPVKPDEVHQDVAAPLIPEQKADEESEPIENDEAQHEPVATLEAEPNVAMEPQRESQPLDPEEAQQEGAAPVGIESRRDVGPPNTDETQHEPAASEGAEPHTEAVPNATEADVVEQDVAAPAGNEPKAAEESEPIENDEAQHEPVATLETEPNTEPESELPEAVVAEQDAAAPLVPEPKADVESEPPETDEAQHEPIATLDPEPTAEVEPQRELQPPEPEKAQQEGVTSAADGAEPESNPTLRELHETQPPEAHTEGQEES
jgi:hypothetical protein